MCLAEKSYEHQLSESDLAIADYSKRNKEKLMKFPNMSPRFDVTTKKVYCVYEPRSIDDLLQPLKSISKKDLDSNLIKFGYWQQREYAYQKLNLSDARVKKKKNNKDKAIKYEPRNKRLTEVAEFFSSVFDTDASVFVHLLNKETGDTYFQPAESLKDKVKLTSILHSHRFRRNNDLMYSLSTFKTMKNATEESVFSIPLIQVDVDYRKIPRYREKTPEQVSQLILEKEVGNTIPHPSAIEYGHQLRLLYKIKDLYMKKGSSSSKNVATRISATFAKRLSQYGAEGQPITSHGRIPGSINSKDGSKIQLEMFGYSYEIETIKEEWLDPLPDWYYDWKAKRKGKSKIRYLPGTYTLNIKRLNDFFRIVDYFNGDLDGRRFLCFTVRSQAIMAGYTSEEAKDMMFDLNNRFKSPLKEPLIEQDTRNVERKQYAYKSKNILERLSITPELEEKLNLKTIISSTEKKRRNRVNKSRRYREEAYGNPIISKRSLIEAEKLEIKALWDEGIKKKEISNILSIKPKTLQRRMREMEKEGLV
ncbi:winged helix-turn-helix domain-containing protein [Terribacillus halophilus]|uniref:winged helix-turn-helix domain-containing protein n=1 Tax=Terribacillus halophilus TaxID=361279 RepID=UPI0009866762|nr:winged helix-turn-helix domain-containing protein [Terribacillus halophilus]